ncbi:MAG: DUF3224 domain-containing protein [Nocardioidaceae bacterium]
MSYSHKAVCRFSVSSWAESPIVDIDGEGTTFGDNYYPSRGLTRAEVTYTYTGDIEGTGALTYLIAYHPGAAPVVGFERFEGSVGGQDGTCVLRHTGSQDSGSVRARLEVVAGMGTGGLTGLRGEAELAIEGHSDDGYELVLAYGVD